MNSTATASKTEKVIDTLPFFNIPKLDREEIFDKITFFTKGNLQNLNAPIAKLSVKTLVGKQGCCFAGKVKVVTKQAGDVLYIPIKNFPQPVEVSVAYLRLAMQWRMNNA